MAGGAPSPITGVRSDSIQTVESVVGQASERGTVLPGEIGEVMAVLQEEGFQEAQLEEWPTAFIILEAAGPSQGFAGGRLGQPSRGPESRFCQCWACLYFSLKPAGLGSTSNMSCRACTVLLRSPQLSISSSFMAPEQHFPHSYRLCLRSHCCLSGLSHSLWVIAPYT